MVHMLGAAAALVAAAAAATHPVYLNQKKTPIWLRQE
jgi:hypothetical protein